MFRKSFLFLLVIALAAGVTALTQRKVYRKAVAPISAQQNLEAALTQEEQAAVLRTVLESDQIKNSLVGNRYRLSAMDVTVVKVAGGLQRQAHTQIYDYAQNKMHHIVNDITAGVPGTIIETRALGSQMLPTAEEYAEAKAMVLNLDQVKQLMSRPNIVLQEGFPVDCGTHRCVEIQVNEIVPKVKASFLLFVTVDLSDHKIVEVRPAKSPSSMAR